MSKGKYEDVLVDMANELISNCDWCSCQETGTDENGNEYVSYTCPFYRHDSCIINDPSTWDVRKE